MISGPMRGLKKKTAPDGAHKQTDGHGDPMTNSAQWVRVGEKLQCGTSKCNKMHIRNTRKQSICSSLYIDDWKEKDVTSVETGIRHIEDEYEGETVLATFLEENILEIKYLLMVNIILILHLEERKELD